MDGLARRAFVAVNLAEMKPRIYLTALLLTVCGVAGLAQRRPIPAANAARTLTIATEANAIVWFDEIRRGATDEGGKLSLAKVSPGAHSLRVRAGGFKEVTLPISPAQRGEVRVRLARTTDEAELTFQQAESARDTARDDEA